MSALEAEDVVWDLSDLLHGRDDEDAVGDLLDQADVIADVVGRAGSWASLRFAVDVKDPTRGALVQKVSERSSAITTKLLWFELEWAALDDARVDELLADDGLAFCA